MHSSRCRLTATSVFVALTLTGLVPSLASCGPPSSNVREGDAIPPISAGASRDLGLGPGIRPLSFGPGDKDSPRVSPSGESVAFILDNYVAEKPLYAQSLHHSTASELVGAEHAEWLADEGLAILSLQDGAGGQGAGVTPSSDSLFGTPPDGSSGVRRIADGVTTAGPSPEGGAIAAIEIPSESTEDPVWSRLVLLRSSDEPTMVYLRSIKGTISGLSVSPDGRTVVMAIRRVTDDGEDRYEVQTFRLSDGSASRVTRLPAGMEILGAPQWTQGGILYVAGKVGAQAGGTDRNPALYALYRVPPGSDTPESVPGVGEDFVAATIS